jgi:glycosyltransferase involved in cell wall biosynthesis
MYIVLAATTDLSYDQRMQRTASALAAAGHKVLLIGRKKKKSIPLPTSWIYATERISCFFEKGKLFYIEFNLRLFLKLIRCNADVLCCADLDTMVAGSMAKRLKGCKLVYDAHEFFTEVPELSNRGLVKTIWEIVGNMTVPSADLCYTVGQKLADILSAKYKRQFAFVRNMPTKYSGMVTVPAQNVTNEPYFIYTGAVNAGRGIALLIEVFAGLPYRLVVAGDGDLLQQMKALHITRYPEAKVDFTGYLTPEALRNLTSGAIAGFNLLEADCLNYTYSLANKFFDYVMAGIPQICIKLPEYEALNEEYEVALLTGHDAFEVSKNIQKLIDDKELQEKLRLNCMQAAKVWNWENEQKKLLRLIDTLQHKL